MSTTDAIEKEIVEKGLTAPRVTLNDIHAVIQSEHYFTAADGVFGASGNNINPTDKSNPLNLITFCVLVLNNGFTAHGVSAVASPENFDKEIGQKVAKADALSKIWPLLGYELKTKLSDKSKNILHLDMGSLSHAEVSEYTKQLQQSLKP